MAWQPLAATRPAAGLALLPVASLPYTWPQVLAWVPTHWSAAGPGHFVRRAWLLPVYGAHIFAVSAADESFF